MEDIMPGIIMEYSGIENSKPNDVRFWRIPLIVLK